ncbi:MAG: magnesium transporter CorA family protein [Pseudomonadales bacterium]|nr:magnesium transporter CorA family protein [Pseudomonadales bacterium]
MKRVMLYSPGDKRIVQGGTELIDTWRSGNGTIWVDLADESPSAESRFLEETFGIHPFAIQDAQRDRHPPKFEHFDDYYFLLLKGLSPAPEGTDFDTIQISMFVGDRFLVTRHSDVSLSIDLLWKSVTLTPTLLEQGARGLVPRLTRNIVNRYLELLFQIETTLDNLEQELLGGDPSDRQLTLLATYKTRLRRMSRTFTYHEQIFADLRHDERATEDGKLEHHFNDAYEQLERVESLARLYYDLASDLIDSSISLASHRLNGIMKVLTIITAIFVPMGFLAGVYGMNFDHMPELHYEYSYHILLATMATLAVGLLTLFRFKRWL